MDRSPPWKSTTKRRSIFRQSLGPCCEGGQRSKTEMPCPAQFEAPIAEFAVTFFPFRSDPTGGTRSAHAAKHGRPRGAASVKHLPTKRWDKHDQTDGSPLGPNPIHVAYRWQTSRFFFFFRPWSTWCFGINTHHVELDRNMRSSGTQHVHVTSRIGAPLAQTIGLCCFGGYHITIRTTGKHREGPQFHRSTPFQIGCASRTMSNIS